jgi:hypothetical protein
METIETIVIQQGERSATITIHPDTDPESPREWGNLGKMAMFHRRYSLPNDDKIDMAEAKRIEKDRDYIWLPIYGYDHGGLTISVDSFSCPWDSGRLGIIYVHKNDVRKEYNTKRIDLKTSLLVSRRLIDEVKVYDQYLAGDVYGYKVTVGDEENSCWGFYGLDECKKEARSVALAMLETIKQQQPCSM